jgi:catechol 2,3-dioxygenase
MSTGTPQLSHTSIAPATVMGTVSLTVRDLARSRQFYEQALGLHGTETREGALALSAPGGAPLVELRGEQSAPALNRRATGLYHLAILFPSRRDLAFALARLSAARWPLDGASDHLVSEALYLSDPDGNGIELYRDRPRADWQRRNGELAMATLPLEIDSLVAELSDSPSLQRHAPQGTTIGHVHLQVSDLAAAEVFYSGVLGFDVVVRGYPGALFVSAGGYHHHLGLNTWHSAGASPPAPGAIGLRSFEVIVPDSAELDRLRERIEAAGLQAEPGASEPAEDAIAVRDPSGNRVLLRTA